MDLKDVSLFFHLEARETDALSHIAFTATLVFLDADGRQPFIEVTSSVLFDADEGWRSTEGRIASRIHEVLAAVPSVSLEGLARGLQRWRIGSPPDDA